MTRFNFLAPTTAERLVRNAPRPSPQLKRPIRVLIALITLIAATDGVETLRLHQAEDERLRSVKLLERSEAAVRNVKHLQSELTDERRLAAAVQAIQESGGLHANDLAWIGNRLPTDTWLSSLHIENGQYSLEGTANRVAAVANAMTALTRSRALGEPHLVTIVDDHDRKSGSVVHYALQLEAAPR